MIDDDRCVNDHMTVINDACMNGLFGDASTMDGDSRGGNDTLTGGDHSINLLYGDAHDMHDNARGGDDTVVGVDLATTIVSDDLYVNAFDAHDSTPAGTESPIGDPNSFDRPVANDPPHDA